MEEKRTVGRPPLGDGKRTEKITVHITPEAMADFRRLAGLQQKTTATLLLEMIEQKIKDNADALRDIRNAEEKLR